MKLLWLLMMSLLLAGCALQPLAPVDTHLGHNMHAPASEAVGAAAEVTSTPAAVPQPAALRYLALGDSYTIGESVEANERYPEQLAARLRQEGVDLAPVEIIARTGWTTGDLSAAIQIARPQPPYDLVTLLIGVNDQFRGRSLLEYEAKFSEVLITAISLAGDDPTKVIVLSIPDYSVTPFVDMFNKGEISRAIARFNESNRRISEAAGVMYVDITPISQQAGEGSPLLAWDGLHPSGEMYAMWVELLLPPSQQILAAPLTAYP